MTMTRSRRGVKTEGNLNNDDDVEMGDGVYVTHSDGLPARGYETSSSETLQALEHDFRPRQQPTPSQSGVSNGEDDGIKAMGRGVAAVADVMAELRILGVSHRFGVPELIALGEQSAGKSSVIGALAGIHLPSGPGTCTRVPVQIKTRDDPEPGATWVCRVVLELAYAHSKSSKPAGHTGVKIGPWWEKASPDMVEFVTITDKDDLNEVMKAAQMAILNPQHDPADYVPDSGSRWGSPKMLESFSPNLIVLDISEPGHQDLSLIDLPGIIQIGSSDELVGVVSKLVKHFINRKNALLLCCLPMSGDPQNSAAIRYVKEAKATDRCIGILTKPDLMSSDDVKNVWIPLLRNQKEGFKMEHSYWVSKQPPHGSDGRKISHEQARKEEADFFANKSIDSHLLWITDLLEFQDRFGTPNLRDALGRKLAYCIQLELPNIKTKIQDRNAAIDRRLDQLPKSVEGEVQSKVLNRLRQFANGVHGALDTRSPHFREWRDIRRQFRDVIALLMPKVALKDKTDDVGIPPQPPQFKDRDGGARIQEFIELDSDDGSVRPRGAETPESGREKKFAFSTGNMKNGREIPRPMNHNQYFIGYRDHALRFSLRDIQAIIREFGHCELPGDVDPEVKVDMCRRSVAVWHPPMESLLEIVANQLDTLFKRVLDNALSDYFLTELYTEAEEKLKEFLDVANVEVKKAVQTLFDTENSNPFTVNEKALNREKRQALETIKEKRKKVRAIAFQDRHERGTKKYTYGAKRAEIIAKITDEQLGPDPFEKEVDCMAYVKAYYEIASSRWVDNICQAVQTLLFSFIKLNIAGLLERKLDVIGDGGPERCRMLVERIAPEIAVERETLQQEKDNLIKAFRSLNHLFHELALEERKPVAKPVAMVRRQSIPSRRASAYSAVENKFGREREDDDNYGRDEPGDKDIV